MEDIQEGGLTFYVFIRRRYEKRSFSKKDNTVSSVVLDEGVNIFTES